MAFYTYIATNRSKTLYTGITNDLTRRIAEHRAGLGVFTAKYKIDTVVWYEMFKDPTSAIAMEKKIKGWSRAKKIALIEKDNLHWDPLVP